MVSEAEVAAEEPRAVENVAKALDYPLVVRQGAVVVGAAVSVGSFVAQLFLGEDVAAFLSANELSSGPRNAQLAVLAGAGGLAAAGVAVTAWRRPGLLHRAAPLAAPFLLAAAFPLLFSRDAWRGQELAFLVFAGGFGLLFEALLRPALSQGQGGRLSALAVAAGAHGTARIAAWLLVACGVAFYGFRTGTLVTLSHERMATSSSDLAEFDNLFFNALSGHPFRAPAIEGLLGDWTALKIHAEFLLYLLLPFYAISPGPEALLWIQTWVIAVTAIPIFLFAADRLGRFGALAVTFAFLFCPAVQRPNFYDFHFTPTGMLCVAWWVWSANRLVRARERGEVLRGLRLLGPFFLFGALTMLSREDTALGFGLACLLLALLGVLPKLTASLGLAACVYFGVMKFAIMSRFGPGWFDVIYDDLKAPGAKGFHGVVVTLVTNPLFVVKKLLVEAKLLYLLHMTVPVLFLWWRRPLLVLAALPAFPFTLMVTNRAPMFESSFQYTYHWIAYVFAASVLGLELVSRRHGSHAKIAGAVALVIVATASNVQLGALFGGANIVGGFGPKALTITEEERARTEDLRRLVEQIPASASVAATEAEGPHVSTRLDFFSLKFTLGDEPEYLLLGKPGMRRETDHVREALTSQRYGLVARSGPFVLLKRGADPSQNAELLRELTRRR